MCGSLRDEQAAKALTVSCDRHDRAMQHDPVTCVWSCPVAGCRARLSDEDADRLTGEGRTDIRVT